MMRRTRRTHLPRRAGARRLALAGTAALAAGLLAFAVAGATSALWRTQLTDEAALTDAAVLFAVDGKEATADEPTLTVAVGPDAAQTLLDEGAFALPIEVQALSQGNRGLRYEITLPTTDEDDILHWAELTIFPVVAPTACTVEATAPNSGRHSSTPVAATYSDSSIPTTEYWCLRAELGNLPDVGPFTSTAAIVGTHALGELTESVSWHLDVTTAFAAADEPTHRVLFTYETFRAGN